MIIAMFLLALFYLLFSFSLLNAVGLTGIFKKRAYKHTNFKRILGAIGTGFILFTLTLGILFKLGVYPGSKVLLKFGLVAGSTIAIIAGIFYLKKGHWFYKKVLIRVGVFLIVGLATLMVPKQTSQQLSPSEEVKEERWQTSFQIKDE